MRTYRAFLLVSLLTLTCAAAARAADTLNFDITRADLPKLTYYDLTLRVDACGATAATVTGDDKPVESRIEKDKVIFTTSATHIAVTLTGVTDRAHLGQVSKAMLKDDKLWAWSAGFDDNTMFKSTAIPLLDKYGYRGTVFLIGSKLDAKRDEGWIIDRPDIIRLLKKGWGIGNHTWTHINVPAEKGAAAKYGTPDWTPTPADMAKADEEVRKTYEFLRESCDQAGRPDYRIIAFAAPMFDGRWQPVIDDLKKKGRYEVLFNESGNRTMMIVDPDFVVKDRYGPVCKFDPALSIGRDPGISAFGSGTKNDPKDKLTAEIAKCGEHYHLWYVTLNHGVGEKDGVMTFIPWVNDTYGKAGSNTVWVAPSDEVYSYLLVRDASTVTLHGAPAGPASNPTTP